LSHIRLSFSVSSNTKPKSLLPQAGAHADNCQMATNPGGVWFGSESSHRVRLGYGDGGGNGGSMGDGSDGDGSSMGDGGDESNGGGGGSMSDGNEGGDSGNDCRAGGGWKGGRVRGACQDTWKQDGCMDG
jgi:hypothetical protein